jgi:HlyD family secretion protein
MTNQALAVRTEKAAIVLPSEARKDIRSGVCALSIFAALIGGWAIFAPLDAAVIASGMVEVAGNRKSVQAVYTGIVRSTHVVEGQRVAKGQVLIELSSDDLDAELNAVEAQLIDAEARLAALKAEAANAETLEAPPRWSKLSPSALAIADEALKRQAQALTSQRQALKAQLDVLAQRAGQAEAQAAGMERQRGKITQQVKLLDADIAAARQLAEKGYGSQARVRLQSRAQAEVEEKRAELETSIGGARERVLELKLQSASLISDRGKTREKETADLDLKAAELRARFAGLNARLQANAVRATASGRVLGLSVFTVGAVVAPGQQLLQIVPERPELVLKGRIDPRDADDVYPGQKSEIRISALNTRFAPLLAGTVSKISSDSLLDERTNLRYFTIEVNVATSELARLGQDAGGELKPGLPVEILIPIRSRTAFEFVFEPLTQSMWTAFRQN